MDRWNLGRIRVKHMNATKRESGQVFVLAALSLMVLIGIAAFATNASYMFYQHMRMQAQVDEQTRLAAGSGCTAGTSTLDGGKLVITPVAPLGFFGQDGTYCDGLLTKSPGGLFGSILRFPNSISVHAVAEHGGSTEPHFAVLGLSTVGDSHGCSVDFAGGGTIGVTGNVYSDSAAGVCGSNNTNVSYVNNAQYSSAYFAPANRIDPYRLSFSSTGPNAVGPISGGATYCGYHVPSRGVYYHPVDASGYAVLPDIKFNGSNPPTPVVLLPLCDSAGEHPGIYIVGSHNFTINSGEVDVVRSMIVVTNLTNFTLSGGVFNLTSPTTTKIVGYGVYEYTPCSPDGNYNLGGNGTTIKVNGVFDLSCADIKFQGNATEEFDGSLIANTIDFGANSGSVTFNPPFNEPARGAFLVQ